MDSSLSREPTVWCQTFSSLLSLSFQCTFRQHTCAYCSYTLPWCDSSSFEDRCRGLLNYLLVSLSRCFFHHRCWIEHSSIWVVWLRWALHRTQDVYLLFQHPIDLIRYPFPNFHLHCLFQWCHLLEINWPLKSVFYLETFLLRHLLSRSLERLHHRTHCHTPRHLRFHLRLHLLLDASC